MWVQNLAAVVCGWTMYTLLKYTVVYSVRATRCTCISIFVPCSSVQLEGELIDPSRNCGLEPSKLFFDINIFTILQSSYVTFN